MKRFIFILVILVMLSYGMIYLDKSIKPTFISVAELKVQSMMSRITSEAIKEKFTQGLDYKDFLIIGKDEQGNVTLVQSNVVVMNQMAADLSLSIQDKLKSMTTTKVEISLGDIMANQIMTQIGPMIELKVLPLGTAKANFKTEFENAGINQTRYKIFLEVECKAKIIIPFSPHTTSVKTVVPVAETVVVGKVPQSYVYIPEKNIPNTLNNLMDVAQ